MCKFGVTLTLVFHESDNIKNKRHEDRAGLGERKNDRGSMRVGQPEPGSSGGLAFSEASH